MPLHKRSELAETSVYTFHDDSRHACVVLGTSFNLPKEPAAGGISGIRHFIAHIPAVQTVWRKCTPLFTSHVIRQMEGVNSDWLFDCEESATLPKQFRIVMTNAQSGMRYYYEVKAQNGFCIEAYPADVMDKVPESVFGCLLGAATGATEARSMLHDRLRRGEGKNMQPSLPRALHSDWRAPRFSFTLRTATGSPFAERWGFSIQESVREDGGFRVWVEQQRTGREVYLRMRQDGGIEGLKELEQLPAAIHGAGLGMLKAFHYITTHIAQAIEKGEMEAADLQVLPAPMMRPAAVKTGANEESPLLAPIHDLLNRHE